MIAPDLHFDVAVPIVVGVTVSGMDHTRYVPFSKLIRQRKNVFQRVGLEPIRAKNMYVRKSDIRKVQPGEAVVFLTFSGARIIPDSNPGAHASSGKWMNTRQTDDRVYVALGCAIEPIR